MTLRRTFVVLGLCMMACNAKEAAMSRITVFVDRHGAHMKAIAVELAPVCTAALAAPSEPPSVSLPFGSLVQDATVLQVAAICSRDGTGGPIVASLRDPSAEGGSVLPATGCTEVALASDGGDTVAACYDAKRASTTIVRRRHPIEGGVVDVIAIFGLPRG